jgi:hypothetical protein
MQKNVVRNAPRIKLWCGKENKKDVLSTSYPIENRAAMGKYVVKAYKA